MKPSRWQRRLRTLTVELSRWSLWLTCGAAVIWFAWTIFQWSRKPAAYDVASLDGKGAVPAESAARPRMAPATATPSRDDELREVVQRFPADSDLWPLAAVQLFAVDPKAASRILLAAAEGGENAPSVHGDAAVACLLAGDPLRASRQLDAVPGSGATEGWRIDMAARAMALVARQDAANHPGTAGAPALRAGGDQEKGAPDRAEFVEAGAHFLAASCLGDGGAAGALAELAGRSGGWQVESERLLAGWLPNPREALAWAQRAADSANSLQDWERCAVLLARSGGDPAPAEARAAQAGRASAPAARSYLGWMMVEGRLEDALAWIKALPPEIGSDAGVREREATVECRLGRIDPLRGTLLAGAWGRENPQALEYALGAVLQATHSEAQLAEKMWTQAMGAARADPTAIVPLLRLAETSGLRAETKSAFEAIAAATWPPDSATGANEPGRRRQFAWRFYSWARTEGDADLAQRAARAWLDADPSSEHAQAAWSRMVLIRHDGANLDAAVAQIEGLCRTRSEYLPELAYARHVEGRDADAILILSRLSPTQLSSDGQEWVQGVTSRLADVFTTAPP